MNYKDIFCATIGFFGSIISALFGGFDAAMVTLVAFMIIDFCSGLICAGVFEKSQKTESGALSSNTCWKGVCKKVMTLVLVYVAHRIDVSIGASYVKDTVTIGFIASELISILENAGCMGLPIPSVLTDAVELLKSKVGGNHE